MALNISKAVRSGMVVMRHGDKFVRCSRRGKPAGIYRGPQFTTLLTDTGQVSVSAPAGVVIYGNADALASLPRSKG